MIFDMKVTTIEKDQDISNMRIDKPIKSLQTFELAISDKSDKKNKIIVFRVKYLLPPAIVARFDLPPFKKKFFSPLIK